MLLEAEIFNVLFNPPAFSADQLRAPLACAIYRPAFTRARELSLRRLRSERSAVEREALSRIAFTPWLKHLAWLSLDDADGQEY